MSPVNLRLLETRAAGFADEFGRLIDRSQSADPAVENTVRGILADVRARGDDALVEHTRRFDRRDVASAAALEVPVSRLALAAKSIGAEQFTALQQAVERIRRYHEKQKIESWHYTEADGTELGQQVTALERVGLYVPGGKAAYPSSVLMNAIPAKVGELPNLSWWSRHRAES